MKDKWVKLKDGGLYKITKEQLQMWDYIYPDLDILAEIEFLEMEWDNNLKPRKTAKNISKYINKHLAKQNKEDL